MATDGDKRLERRVIDAAEAALAARGYVTAIDVLAGIGWLPPSSERAWRQGRIPYLERGVTANLNKVSRAMRHFRRWAEKRGLSASETAYVGALATGARCASARPASRASSSPTEHTGSRRSSPSASERASPSARAGRPIWWSSHRFVTGPAAPAAAPATC